MITAYRFLLLVTMPLWVPLAWAIDSCVCEDRLE